MVNLWKRFLVYWVTRRTVAEYVELNRLLTKAGRRCAYDLRHAAGAIYYASLGERESERASTECERYSKKADHWLHLFNPADDGKNYRDRLHHTIWDLEDRVEKYQKLLAEHGIKDTVTDNDIPF